MAPFDGSPKALKGFASLVSAADLEARFKADKPSAVDRVLETLDELVVNVGLLPVVTRTPGHRRGHDAPV